MLETEFVAASQSGSGRLMVVLHGLGDSTAGYRWLPSMLRFPWLNYLLVNAPDEYYGGYSWYDFAADPAPGIERSRLLLSELLADWQHKGFSADQTVVFGFSQGCLMTMEVGLKYSEHFAGLVGISGYVHQLDQLLTNLSPVALEQRILFTHGRYDPLIPFEPVKEQIRALQSKGLHIEWHEFDKDHTIAGEEEVDVIRRFVAGCYESSPVAG